MEFRGYSFFKRSIFFFSWNGKNFINKRRIIKTERPFQARELLLLAVLRTQVKDIMWKVPSQSYKYLLNNICNSSSHREGDPIRQHIQKRFLFPSTKPPFEPFIDAIFLLLMTYYMIT